MNFNNKIAVFGGSFNPPTKSHEKIIKDLSKVFKKVLIVPVFLPPHKNSLISYDHRVKMLEMLIENIDNCQVSKVDKEVSLMNFKNKREATNYTYETMEYLRNNNKQELVFVSGPDVVIDSYKNYEKIGEYYTYKNNHVERSSDFRIEFKKGNYSIASNFLTFQVWNYVVENKLYDPKINVNKKVISDGYFSLLEFEVVYDGDEMRENKKPDKKVFSRNIIDPKNSIGITLIDPVNKKILIKREKRFGPYIEEEVLFSYGVIEGTMEKGECPIECAIREVKEESGIDLIVDDVKLINKWYPSAGYMTEVKHVLLGFFNVEQYERAGGVHGLVSENEEIYTEIFDIEEVLLYHATQGSNIYSPEIASVLLYYKFGTF